VRGLRVHYSDEVAARLEGYHRSRQGRVRLEVSRVAASRPERRFVRVETALDLAACEVLADRGMMLVYAVVPKRELMRMLWGPEVDEMVSRRRISELTHGRWWGGSGGGRSPRRSPR
jgi:hypothetical protein